LSGLTIHHISVMSEYVKNTILVVGNHADMRESLALLLECEGYHVALAANNREVVEYLQGSTLPRLILLDLMMSEMGGWEFLQHRERDPLLASVSVVILAAAADAEKMARKLGAAQFLVKPFDPRELLTVVRRLCP
jgi:CheY-like chemotaxis protein